jgi:phosphohistidine phosphatase
MIILLVRHAHAGDRDASRWPDDTQRPLTSRGREVARRMARRLRQQHMTPTLILSSPWKRAWQSAQVLQAETGAEVEVGELGALAVTPAVAPIARAVGAQDAKAIVALVGHEPWISELASLLLTGRRESVPIDFPKAGVLGLELSEVRSGGARLRFFLRPKQARRAG